MGLTTAGKSTSNNSVWWTDIYQRCTAFMPKSFALHTFIGEIKKENEQLTNDLGYLDNYYGDIQLFLMFAKTAKEGSYNEKVQQELNKIETNLCSNDRLLNYRQAAIGALLALASVAEKTQTYISSSSSTSKLSGEESKLLTALLKAVQSISKNVKEDFVAEVSVSPGESLGVTAGTQYDPNVPQLIGSSATGPQVWDAYVRERAATLWRIRGVTPEMVADGLAAAAVGGTHNMPPVPKPPATG